MSDGEEKVENIKDENNNARIYEIGYLLVPTMAGETVPVAYGNMKNLVTSLGGQLIADEMPRQIPLAYTMPKVYKNIRSKFDSAYFGWIKFEIGRSELAALKKKLDLDPEIIRFLIMKTVKENTIAAKRFIRGDMARRRPPQAKREAGTEPHIEINKEEIDKEIDALIAV